MRWLPGNVALLAILSVALCRGTTIAAEVKPASVQNQIEVDVIHVDKYGVYAPNIIFYWDTSMNKKKISSLTSMAEKLRNKKALITYAARGDLSNDDRPLLVDIAAVAEEPKQDGALAVGEQSQSGEADHNYSPEGRPEAAGESEVNERRFSESKSEGGPEDYGYGKRSPDEPSMDQSERPPRQGSKLTESYESGRAQDADAMKSPQQAPPIAKEDVRKLITLMLSSIERKDLSSVLTCYGDTVDYYTRGRVGRDYVKRDMTYYFRNWDRITSTLDGDIVLIVTDEPDVRTAKFILYFSVENANKSVSGVTENVWKIKKTGNSLRIVDVKQRVISAGTSQAPLRSGF